MENQNIHIGGSVSGRNIAVGSNIAIKETGVTGAELAQLIGSLRGQLDLATLPPATREAIAEEVMPDLDAAGTTPDAKAKVETGLGKLNLLLRGAGATAEQLRGIARGAADIAKAAGVVFTVAAPWLARLL